ncbi:MAG TPA: phosphate permease, partial [Marinilabiliaceae bacterium]|nr:phosphate permease [Marinilabiliaceae bacterium]
GLDSYLHYINTPGARPDTLLMSFLSEPAQTETYILLIAGLVMVITLFTSKKARRVIKTEVDLGRQSEGEERFGSSFFARSLVRGSLSLSKSVSKIVPARLKNYLDKQFEQPDREQAAVKKGAPAFDLLRASVNLVIASILIASATSLKLPLSTTYVTFMVAMGSSLSDRAWDRDSAVYRITGVLSVIGGWFFTAFSAFTVAFLVAIALSYGGLWVLFGMLALVIFILAKSHLLNKSQDSEQIIDNEAEFEEIDGFIVSEKVQEQCKLNVTDVLTNVSEFYTKTLKAFEREDRKLLKDTAKQVNALSLRSKKMRSNIYKTVRRLQEENIDSGLYYVQVLDYLRETAQCLTFITNPCWDHLNNNHKPFSDEQFADFRSLQQRVKNIIDDSVEMIESGNFTEIERVLKAQSVILEQIRNLRKTQLKRIKKEKSGTKVSMLYLGVLHETQSMMLHLVNLVKANRDFAAYLK